MSAQFIDQLQLADRSVPHVGRIFARADGTIVPESADELASFAAPEQPEGFDVSVDKGSLVCFVAGVSPQAQSDVLNSTLLAQLAADKKFDRETQVLDWYKEYNSVLGRIGWVVQGFDFKLYKASSMSFTMDKVVLEIAAAVLTGAEAAIIASVLKALAELPEKDGQLSLFDRATHSERRGNFQIALVSETDGAVAMKNMAFTFETNDEVTNVLFFRFSSSGTTLHTAAQAQTLNSGLYAGFRDQIIRKLGKSITDFIEDLDI